MLHARAGTDRPVVIVSVTRSGSTLLQRALNTIDGLTIWGEHFGILTPLLRSVRIASRHGAALERGKSFCADVQDVDAAGYVANPHVNPFDCGDYTGQLRNFVARLFSDDLAPGDRWGFKEVRYGRFELEAMLDLFPDLLVIVLAREPAHQIDSMARTPWTRVPNFDDVEDRELLRRQVQQYGDRWTARYAEFKEFAERHPRSVTIVRYDELTSSRFPAARIADFLDVAIDRPDRLAQVFETRLGSSDSTKWSSEMRQELERMISEIEPAPGHDLVRAFFLD